MGLIESGKIREISCGTNFAYIIEENGDFSTTEYKVLQSQNSGAFIRCMKLLFNGKVELYYQTEGLRSLASMLTAIDGEGFMTIISNLFTSIIEVKTNGFLACQNIDISFNKIYVDPTNYMVRLIYIPTKTRGYETYGMFENELRTSIVRLLGTTPSISSPKTITLSMDLIDGALSLENLAGKCKGSSHGTAGVARRSTVTMPGQMMDRAMRSTPLNLDVMVGRVQGNPMMNGQTAGGTVLGGLKLVAPSKITFDINKNEFVIGKHPTVDGVITFNTAISRYHCKVLHINGGYYVEDLGSSNGTYLNRMRLEPNRPAGIKNGDCLRLADIDFQVCVM